MGYIYIVEFNHKTKYGISDNDPLDIIKTHQADLRKVGLDDTIMNMGIMNTSIYRDVEKYLKGTYGSEWVSASFSEIYELIKNKIDVRNVSNNRNITTYEVIDFLNDPSLINDTFIYKIKKLYEMYENECIIKDLRSYNFDEFKKTCRELILEKKVTKFEYNKENDTVFYNHPYTHQPLSFIDAFFKDENVPFIEEDDTKTRTQMKRTSTKKLENQFKNYYYYYSNI